MENESMKMQVLQNLKQLKSIPNIKVTENLTKQENQSKRMASQRESNTHKKQKFHMVCLRSGLYLEKIFCKTNS